MMKERDSQVLTHMHTLRQGGDVPDAFADTEQEATWRFAIASHILADQAVGRSVIQKVREVLRGIPVSHDNLFQTCLSARERYTEALLSYFIEWGNACKQRRDAIVSAGGSLDRIDTQLYRYDMLSEKSGRKLWNERLTPSANVLFNGCVGGLDVMLDVVMATPLLLSVAQKKIDAVTYEQVLKNTITHMYERAQMGSIKNSVITSETPFVVDEHGGVLVNPARYKLAEGDDGIHVETSPQFTSSSMAEYFFSGTGRMLDCPALHAQVRGASGEPLHANLIRGLYDEIIAFGVRTLSGSLPNYITELQAHTKKTV